MTILFMGGEMSAFVPSDASVAETTTSVRFDSTFSRCAVEAAGTNAYSETGDFTASDELWLHVALTKGLGSGTSSAVKAIVLAASGTNLIRVNVNYASGNSHTLTLQYWNGLSFTTAAGSFTVDLSVIHHIDMHVVANSASGSITVYDSGTERLAATGLDLTSVTNLTNARFYGRDTSSGMAVSQVIVADESTIGWRLLTRYPSAAGATSAWTGAYTDIDETVYNDADFILSASANQVSTFAQTGPAITGYTVRAVAVSARAKRGATGPQNLRHVLRVSGTDYPSGSDIALDAGYTATQTIWEQNPATSADWVNTAIDGLQPGVKSIA